MRTVPILAAGLLVVAAGAGAVAPPAAAPPRYAVEVLVFRYTGPGAAQGESWPPTVAPPPLSGAVYPAAAATGTYVVRPAASATIARARAHLAAAGGYRNVAERGWSQPGLSATAARPVSLTPPVATAAPAAGARAAFSQTAPQAAPQASPAPATVQFAGTATLIVADNKPHIALDLRLCEPPPPGVRIQAPVAATAPPAASAAGAAPALSLAAPAAATPRQCFALRQRRQVTVGRLEYFDNPAFGALVLVTPLTPPAPAAGAPPATSAPGRSRTPGWP